jgi:hypothetical protein
MIIYSLLVSFVASLIDPSVLQPLLLDKLLENEMNKGWISVLLILLLIAIFGFGALIIREFWNRLICKLFEITKINFSEAFSILLLIGIIQQGA